MDILFSPEYNSFEVIDVNMPDRIKQARTKKGYNQEYVAQMLGVSRQAVSKWETGQTQPDTKNLIALAKLLDTNIDHLANGAESTPHFHLSKSAYLRRGSIILFAFSLLFAGIGFFSGLYSTMLFLPISDTVSIGIPLIWYGKTALAGWVKIFEVLFLILSFLIRIIAWATQDKKQALA